MLKNILISGGTGFVGSNFINISKDYYNCINVGRSKNNLCENFYWNLKESFNYSINKNIDTVIHCASIVGNINLPKSEYIDVNVKSTLELLEYSIRNNVKKFIYISTGGVYGYNKEKFYEDSICNPIDLYSMSKYFSEKLCELYSDKISVVILRLFFPYGNGQDGRMFSNLTKNIIYKKEITLNKNGFPIINPIHIFDVVNIINKIIETDCNGVFNASGNEYVSLIDLCNRIAFHAKIEKVNIVFKDNEVGNLIGVNEKICNHLNYKITVDLDSGIKMYLNNLNL